MRSEHSGRLMSQRDFFLQQASHANPGRLLYCAVPCLPESVFRDILEHWIRHAS